MWTIDGIRYEKICSTLFTQCSGSNFLLLPVFPPSDSLNPNFHERYYDSFKENCGRHVYIWRSEGHILLFSSFKLFSLHGIVPKDVNPLISWCHDVFNAMFTCFRRKLHWFLGKQLQLQFQQWPEVCRLPWQPVWFAKTHALNKGFPIFSLFWGDI